MFRLRNGKLSASIFDLGRVQQSIRSVSSNKLSWQNPYNVIVDVAGYKDIMEIQKFQKLLHDIGQIGEEEVHRNKESILCSTVPLKLEGPSARICEGIHFESVPLSIDSITSSLSQREWLLLFDSAILAQCIHIQSRIASFEGKGFYTIGPCGEECLSPMQTLSIILIWPFLWREI